MAEGTTMVLKDVDLGCEKCHRKIKKLLCKYPEIRDQVYNEKENTVIIKVVCCNPERIRQKLFCEGGKTIKNIEIKPPSKPDTARPQPKPDTARPQPKLDTARPQPKPDTARPQPKPDTAPAPGTEYPPMFYPRWVSCKLCFEFEGRWGGPCHCHHGSYGIPYQQPPSDGYVKLTLPSYDGWPSGCRCDRSHGCRCEYYNENYPPCTLM